MLVGALGIVPKALGNHLDEIGTHVREAGFWENLLQSRPKCLGNTTVNTPNPVPSLNVVNPSWSTDRAMRANVEQGRGPKRYDKNCSKKCIETRRKI